MKKRKIDIRNLPEKRIVNAKQLKATTVDVEKINAELKTVESLRKNDESSQVKHQRLQAEIKELDKEIHVLEGKNAEIGIHIHSLTVKKHNMNSEKIGKHIMI